MNCNVHKTMQNESHLPIQFYDLKRHNTQNVIKPIFLIFVFLVD